MHKYVGITIGPIVDTICLTTKPAGLWFASSIFSDMTRRLCREISSGDLKGKILSPYYEPQEDMSDGVGKYHDRIIFYTENYDKQLIEKIVVKIKKETIDLFESDSSQLPGDRLKFEEYILNYLQIHFVALDENDLISGNAILTLSPYLDAMELMKTIPQNQENNPFEWILSSNNSNQLIEKSVLFKKIKIENNQIVSIKKQKNIKSIEEIAGFSKNGELKKTSYFATISADGDGMGKFLRGLNTDGDVTRFSKACLKYDKMAANAVKEFGGMTIYAGGDDLLALTPLEGSIEGENKNILDLCVKINQLFNDCVSEEFVEGIENIPTISFGVAVRYYKYPLYEALKNSRELLENAKSKNGKNGIAFQVEKHSGQRMGLWIPNDKVYVVSDVLQDDEDTMKIHGTIFTLENMKSLIEILDKQNLTEDSYWNSWKNFFDNADQKKDENFHNKLCRIYYKHFRTDVIADTRHIDSITIESDNEEPINLFTMLLRIDKFMNETKVNTENE